MILRRRIRVVEGKLRGLEREMVPYGDMGLEKGNECADSLVVTMGESVSPRGSLPGLEGSMVWSERDIGTAF